MTTTPKLTIGSIKALARLAGSHWFDPSTMRFFNSRVERGVYQGPGGVYFVSSEQFVGSDGKAHARKYSVRKVTLNPFSIDTVGEFNTIGYLEDARAEARRLARG